MDNIKIFISHVKEDNEFVEKIIKFFKECGIDYWVDLEQLDSVYSDIVEKINDGLETSNYFLLLWSHSAKKSSWVNKECNAAISGDYNDRLKKIIIRTDDATLPPLLSSKKYHRSTLDSIDSVMYGIMGLIKGDYKTQMKLFRKKVIEDYEKFPKNPIIANFKKFNAHKYYVQQPYRKLSNLFFNINDIATAAYEATRDSDKGAILIVGDYGSGKSAICHYVYYKMCQEFSQDQIPIFIPLGSFPKHDHSRNNLLNEIYEYIKKEYSLSFDKELFNALIAEGKFSFIFDALDELSTIIDPKIAQNNLDHILEIAKTCPTIVTSRFTYIENNVRKKLVNHDNILQVGDFDDDKISKFLELKFEQNSDKISEFKKKIENKSLRQTVSKPLFLNILCEKFDELKNIGYINEAVLFRILTDGWIKHDVLKSKITEQKKKIEERQRCSEILAIIEFKKGNPITLDEIKDHISKEFKFEYANIENVMDLYYKDARDATFLSVESNGSYQYILRPFLEFFVACRIVRDTACYPQRKNLVNISLKLTHEILSFVKAITEIDWLVDPIIFNQIKENPNDFGDMETNLEAKLETKLDLIQNLSLIISDQRDGLEKIPIGNVIQILEMTKNIPNRPNFSNIDISGVSLQFTNLSNSNFNDSNLRESYIENSILSNSTFNNANLAMANLNGSNFIKSTFKNTISNHSNFTNCNFMHADLSYGNFSGSKFSNSNFKNANLMNSIMTGVEMNNCHLVDSKLIDTDFSNADLSDSNLSGQELSSTNLNETDLTNTYLFSAILSNQIILQAKFKNANLSHASFKNSKIIKSDFSNSNLLSTDFAGSEFIDCDFSNAKLLSCDLKKTVFVSPNFENSILKNLDFTNCTLNNVDFSKTIIINCKGLKDNSENKEDDS